MKPLTRKPQVGTILEYVGETTDYVTHGKQYKVAGHDPGDGEAFFFDDDGDHEYLRPSNFGNYRVVDDIEDPGYIEVHTSHERGGDELFVVEVTVDQKAFDLLVKLERQHSRHTERERIQAQIKELQDQLDKI